MSKENEPYNLPPSEDKFLTEQEVRAIVSSSMTNFSGNFRIKSGSVKADGGTIESGSGNDIFKVKDGLGIWLGHADYASAPFKVSLAGALVATSANISGTITATAGAIGGFTIGATTISSTGIILDSDNERIEIGASKPILIDGVNKKIESDNYVSGYAGAGFHLDEDLFEVGNIACRGLIRTSVFQKDTISVMGGNFLTLDGDVLDTDMSVDDNSTLTTKGTTTFSTGDILRIKDGTDDEWLEVTAVNGAVYTCTRDKASAYAADTNPTWKKGATVVNYGQSGDGGVYQTASEANAPYLSVFTHAGSPWTDLTTRLRLGNLNGYLGYSSDLYGIGIGDSTHYLKYDPTNHLRISGDIDASTITGGTFQTATSGQRIVLLGSNNTLKFYDATTESLSIGTAGGQAIKITGNATTTKGVSMTSAVAGLGFYYENVASVQNVGLDIKMEDGGTTTNGLPAIRISYGGTSNSIDTTLIGNGRGISAWRSVGAGTANLLKLSSTNATAGTMADITRSGSGIITALNIDHATSSNSVNTGIIMSLSSGQANLCRAFRFNGSEVVSAAVGGSQNKKLRVNVAGTDYYIPLHTA